MYTHISVLLKETIDALNPQADNIYVDCTLGLGGHTEYIMKRTQGKARVIALDRDSDAIALSQQRLAHYNDAISYYHLPFSHLASALHEEQITHIDGLILDAGISTMQIENTMRGFSFQHHAPLDMRMNTEEKLSAQDVLAKASFDTLYHILKNYGEERLAGKIARAIVTYREKEPLIYTSQLVDIINSVYPPHWKRTARTHPATKTFQALRIYVNNELEELQNVLDTAIDYLSPQARLCVISFHSLEDRIVKHTFKRYTASCICPITVLQCECNHQPRLQIITKKPILPTEEEIAHNPKARSAKLRVAQKV